MKGKKRNLISQRFGKLVVIEETPKRYGAGFVVWKCKCDCGNFVELSSSVLGAKRKPRLSCGCDSRQRNADAHIIHGESRGRLYRTYMSMKTRCDNPNAHEYENYGGRGITVCDEWSDYEAFRSWAIANEYDEKAKRGTCTLDRIDPNKGYSPSNCRWVNIKAQQRNRRNNVMLTCNGETLCLAEWAERLGLNYQTIRQRLRRGWSDREALFGR